tara:strand:+ start:112 stop:411 length:300 start_codon:yes stop_codon:yes gene_type:complete
MRSKFTVEFEKRFGNKIPDRKIPTLAKYFKIKKSLIQDAFNRGVGAYKGNPSSIRPSVKSAEQWAMARSYKFILNVIKKREGKKYPTGAGHDSDLVERA